MRITQGFLNAFFIACLFFLPTAAFTASIQINWLPNKESDLNGYMVYCGTRPGFYTDAFDAGKATSYLLSGAKSGITYYVAVAAYDRNQNFSPLSDEKIIAVPGAVLSTGITPSSPAMWAKVYANPVFRWSGSGFSSYRVCISTDGTNYSRIYTGTGTSCSMQESLWTLFIPSGTKLYWYVLGYTSSGKSVKSPVMRFIKN